MGKNLILVILVGSLLLAGCVTTPTGPAASNITSNGITINTSVSIGASSAIPAATSGQVYSAAITVSGGSPPYGCSAAPGSTLPGSLVFSEPGCSITGAVPTLNPGTSMQIFPISFIVTDSKGKVAGPFGLSLTVTKPKVGFTLPANIDDATIGTDYNYNFCAQPSGVNCNDVLNAQNQDPPYTFTVSGQPLGLSMDLNGLLSGTVPEGANPGEYPISVCITDMGRSSVCADTTLTVKEASEEVTNWHVTVAEDDTACQGNGFSNDYDITVQRNGTSGTMGDIGHGPASGTFEGNTLHIAARTVPDGAGTSKLSSYDVVFSDDCTSFTAEYSWDYTGPNGDCSGTTKLTGTNPLGCANSTQAGNG
ncbi:MAG: putative Ig domain-containing protein [Candidatus Micrarchaeota archaeon]|nr:putative Ig domain-containing protein [Candidatus Micrarchaeota archaeon]